MEASAAAQPHRHVHATPEAPFALLELLPELLHEVLSRAELDAPLERAPPPATSASSASSAKPPSGPRLAAFQSCHALAKAVLLSTPRRKVLTPRRDKGSSASGPSHAALAEQQQQQDHNRHNEWPDALVRLFSSSKWANGDGGAPLDMELRLEPCSPGAPPPAALARHVARLHVARALDGGGLLGFAWGAWRLHDAALWPRLRHLVLGQQCGVAGSGAGGGGSPGSAPASPTAGGLGGGGGSPGGAVGAQLLEGAMRMRRQRQQEAAAAAGGEGEVAAGGVGAGVGTAEEGGGWGPIPNLESLRVDGGHQLNDQVWGDLLVLAANVKELHLHQVKPSRRVQALRALPLLERCRLTGHWAEDAAVEALLRHPRVEHVAIEGLEHDVRDRSSGGGAGAEGAQKGGVGVCRWRTLEMLQMAYVGRLGLMPPMPRLERLTLHDSLNAQACGGDEEAARALEAGVALLQRLHAQGRLAVLPSTSWGRSLQQWALHPARDALFELVRIPRRYLAPLLRLVLEAGREGGVTSLGVQATHLPLDVLRREVALLLMEHHLRCTGGGDGRSSPSVGGGGCGPAEGGRQRGGRGGCASAGGGGEGRRRGVDTLCLTAWTDVTVDWCGGLLGALPPCLTRLRVQVLGSAPDQLRALVRGSHPTAAPPPSEPTTATRGPPGGEAPSEGAAAAAPSGSGAGAGGGAEGAAGGLRHAVELTLMAAPYGRVTEELEAELRGLAGVGGGGVGGTGQGGEGGGAVDVGGARGVEGGGAGRRCGGEGREEGRALLRLAVVRSLPALGAALAAE